MVENSFESGDELLEVDFARQFQESVLSSTILKFSDDTLKQKILDADANQLLVVKSKINSPKTILTVNIYDEKLVRDSL